MNKKKNLAHWLKKAVIPMVAGIITVTAAAVPVSARGYDRRDTVAEEEFLEEEQGFGQYRASKVDPKAWKKMNGVCYNGSGKPIPGAITRGIDVSEWQGKIDWKKVRNDHVDFAMVRISYGANYMDKTYDENMEQAEQAGMPVGTYVYSTATTPEMALKEAKIAIEKMKGYKVSYPVVFDLEYNKMGNLSQKKVSEIALAFCNEVRKAGYYPMVYCNTNWYDNEIDWNLLSGLDVWIARYGDTIQAPSRDFYNYTIWQATDGDGGGVLNPTKGLIDGIPASNNVDVNFGFVDYTKKIRPRYQPVSTYLPSQKPDIGTGEDTATGKNGWYEENGKTYYYKNDEKVKGFNKIGGKYYYFNAGDGHLYRNRKIISRAGNIYYVGPDGARYCSGFETIVENGKKNTYYFAKNGRAYKGWHTIHGKKYYFYKGTAPKSGVRAENIILTSSTGVVSEFDKNGVCIRQYRKK